MQLSYAETTVEGVLRSPNPVRLHRTASVNGDGHEPVAFGRWFAGVLRTRERKERVKRERFVDLGKYPVANAMIERELPRRDG